MDSSHGKVIVGRSDRCHSYRGGEPRLVNGYQQILITASLLFANVHVFSNGLNWTDDEIDLMADLHNVKGQISIDGFEQTHDTIRGLRGAYQKTIDTVERLASKDVVTVVAMTVTPANWMDVGKVAEAAMNAGATVFRAGLTLNAGRALEGNFAITPEQRQAVQEQLEMANEKWEQKIIIPVWENASHKEGDCIDFCTPGYLSWYIRADGIVTPCQVESMALGNILEEPIFEIGHSSRLLKAQVNAKTCHCIRKVKIDEAALPFVENW